MDDSGYSDARGMDDSWHHFAARAAPLAVEGAGAAQRVTTPTEVDGVIEDDGRSRLHIVCTSSPTILQSLGDVAARHDVGFAECRSETDDLGVTRLRAEFKLRGGAPLTKLELAIIVFELKEALAQFRPAPLPQESLEESLGIVPALAPDPLLSRKRRPSPWS